MAILSQQALYEDDRDEENQQADLWEVNPDDSVSARGKPKNMGRAKLLEAELVRLRSMVLRESRFGVVLEDTTTHVQKLQLLHEDKRCAPSKEVNELLARFMWRSLCLAWEIDVEAGISKPKLKAEVLQLREDLKSMSCKFAECRRLYLKELVSLRDQVRRLDQQTLVAISDVVYCKETSQNIEAVMYWDPVPYLREQDQQHHLGILEEKLKLVLARLRGDEGPKTQDAATSPRLEDNSLAVALEDAKDSLRKAKQAEARARSETRAEVAKREELEASIAKMREGSAEGNLEAGRWRRRAKRLEEQLRLIESQAEQARLKLLELSAACGVPLPHFMTEEATGTSSCGCPGDHSMGWGASVGQQTSVASSSNLNSNTGNFALGGSRKSRLNTRFDSTSSLSPMRARGRSATASSRGAFGSVDEAADSLEHSELNFHEDPDNEDEEEDSEEGFNIRGASSKFLDIHNCSVHLLEHLMESKHDSEESITTIREAAQAETKAAEELARQEAAKSRRLESELEELREQLLAARTASALAAQANSKEAEKQQKEREEQLLQEYEEAKKEAEEKAAAERAAAEKAAAEAAEASKAAAIKAATAAAAKAAKAEAQQELAKVKEENVKLKGEVAQLREMVEALNAQLNDGRANSRSRSPSRPQWRKPVGNVFLRLFQDALNRVERRRELQAKVQKARAEEILDALRTELLESLKVEQAGGAALTSDESKLLLHLLSKKDQPGGGAGGAGEEGSETPTRPSSRSAHSEGQEAAAGEHQSSQAPSRDEPPSSTFLTGGDINCEGIESVHFAPAKLRLASVHQEHLRPPGASSRPGSKDSASSAIDRGSRGPSRSRSVSATSSVCDVELDADFDPTAARSHSHPHSHQHRSRRSKSPPQPPHSMALSSSMRSMRSARSSEPGEPLFGRAMSSKARTAMLKKISARLKSTSPAPISSLLRSKHEEFDLEDPEAFGARSTSKSSRSPRDHSPSVMGRAVTRSFDGVGEEAMLALTLPIPADAQLQQLPSQGRGRLSSKGREALGAAFGAAPSGGEEEEEDEQRAQERALRAAMHSTTKSSSEGFAGSSKYGAMLRASEGRERSESKERKERKASRLVPASGSSGEGQKENLMLTDGPGGGAVGSAAAVARAARLRGKMQRPASAFLALVDKEALEEDSKPQRRRPASASASLPSRSNSCNAFMNSREVSLIREAQRLLSSTPGAPAPRNSAMAAALQAQATAYQQQQQQQQQHAATSAPAIAACAARRRPASASHSHPEPSPSTLSTAASSKAAAAAATAAAATAATAAPAVTAASSAASALAPASAPSFAEAAMEAGPSAAEASNLIVEASAAPTNPMPRTASAPSLRPPRAGVASKPRR